MDGGAADRRPVELVGAAVILYVVAGLPVLAGCLVGLLLGVLRAEIRPAAWVPVALLAMLAAAGLSALLGYQLQHGREWARLSVTGLAAPLAAAGLAGAAYGALGTNLVGVVGGGVAIVGVILVVLLNTRPARAYCRDPRRPTGVAWPHYSDR